MEGSQNLNVQKNLNSQYNSQRIMHTDEDDDLLDNEDQDKEIEKYIIQENLQYLDEDYEVSNRNKNNNYEQQH